jgi:salicylate hydroxylase
MNVVAFVSDRSQPPDERVWKGAWVKPVDQNVMLADFADWNQQVVNLLKACIICFLDGHVKHTDPNMSQMIDNPQQWALHELVPLERWTEGRVTLLGDSVSQLS